MANSLHFVLSITLPLSIILRVASLDSRASTISNSHNQTNKQNNSAVASNSNVSSPLPNHSSKKNDPIVSPAVSNPRPVPVIKTFEPVPKTSELQTAIIQVAEPPANAAVTLPSLQSEPDPAIDFGNLLYKLLEEATDLAALKTQKSAAEREFDRREKDFDKTRGNHEKFPATEEVLRKSKETAKKALVTISEKCESKDAALKDIVFKSARLLPNLGSGSTGQDQNLRTELNSLETRCKELEAKIQRQQSFIESQRKERESLDEKYKSLLEDKTVGYDTSLSDIKREALETARTLSELSTKLPDGLQSTLESLSGRVSKLESLNSSKAKEESINIATSKVLADNATTLEGYGQKLQSLDTFVRGSDINPGLTGHISALIDCQSTFREELARAYPNWVSVVERVKAVEDQAPRLDIVETRLGVVETKSSNGSASESKLLATSARLDDLEKRLTSVESLADFKRYSDLDIRLSNVENIRSMPSSTITTSTTPAALPVDLEALKKECIDLVTVMQAASDETLGKDIDTLQTDVKNIQTEMNNLSALKLDTLPQTIVDVELASKGYLAQIDTKLTNWAVDQRNTQQGFDNRVEAVETGIIHLNGRMNNMNTKEMGEHILNQLDTTYPYLRDAQNTVLEHRASLQLAEARFIEMDRTVKTLQDQISGLESRIQQNPDKSEIEALRNRIEELTKHVITSRSLANEAKNEITTLSAALSKKSQEEAKVIVDNFGTVHEDLNKLKDQHEALTNRIFPPKKATMSPVLSESSDRGFGNGSVMNIKGRVS